MMAATYHAIDSRGPIARHYRNLRRGYGDGAWPEELGPMPARTALAIARASARGWELIRDAEFEGTADTGYRWVIGLEKDGATVGQVEVCQRWDQAGCDCWDECETDEERRAVPDHSHFGITSELTLFGRVVDIPGHYDCWGFVTDWPGQDDAAELAWAWDETAQPAVDAARDMVAKLPAWVIAQELAWHEGVDA